MRITVTIETDGGRVLTETAELIPEPPDGFGASLLARAGKTASHAAQRTLLRATLALNGWHLSHAAQILKMTGSSSVLRALGGLGMEREHADVAAAPGHIGGHKRRRSVTL